MSWRVIKNLIGLNITFVPAQHWTKRTLSDAHCSHWGGFVFETKDECILLCWGFGYFSGFKEIGKRFQVDTALLPIGPYEPEWFMKHDYMSPEEAVTAFLDLNANQFIPMHYGTFKLADDIPQEAIDRLINA
ncbi:MBL fold metallo-hydrolase [Gottfriedia sp. OAE603]|uniref:MBL fold metallo-hydrolase n=1 Tax=Gottfriedia sp. OAE603 TaxID=2663872 RepID=UPI001A075252